MAETNGRRADDGRRLRVPPSAAIAPDSFVPWACDCRSILPRATRRLASGSGQRRLASASPTTGGDHLLAPGRTAPHCRNGNSTATPGPRPVRCHGWTANLGALPPCRRQENLGSAACVRTSSNRPLIGRVYNLVQYGSRNPGLDSGLRFRCRPCRPDRRPAPGTRIPVLGC